MHLHQRFHPECRCLLLQGPEFLDRQRPNNQEDGIRTGRLCLVKLVRVDDEIFPQERKFNMRANGFEVPETPLKKLLVGQDGYPHGPILRISAGNIHRVEVRPDDPLRRGRPLHFRNNGEGNGTYRFSQGAGPPCKERTFLQCGHRDGFLSLFHFHRLAVQYVLQEVHARRENSTSPFSDFIARPESIASAAW